LTVCVLRFSAFVELELGLGRLCVHGDPSELYFLAFPVIKNINCVVMSTYFV
jgi:hypothetical protein